MKKNRIPRRCEICMADFTIKLNEFKKGLGKCCSYECAGKYRSVHMVKDRNSNWRGGNLNTLKVEIKIRDNYTCKICGLRDSEIMEVDHVKPLRTHPQLRLDRENLMTLCPNCHARKTIRENKMRKQKGGSVWRQ